MWPVVSGVDLSEIGGANTDIVGLHASTNKLHRPTPPLLDLFVNLSHVSVYGNLWNFGMSTLTLKNYHICENVYANFLNYL